MPSLTVLFLQKGQEKGLLEIVYGHKVDRGTGRREGLITSYFAGPLDRSVSEKWPHIDSWPSGLGH